MQVKEKIKTFLPAFEGFYGSKWELNVDNVLYNINENRKQDNLKLLEYDNIKINYTSYENDIAKVLCDKVSQFLCEYIENIEFENIYSPKTYNFSNDAINCIITPNIVNIQQFIYSHKIELQVYLKNKYTGYDGFISHYSNSFENWESDTKNFTDFNINSHALGSILQFIFDMKNIDELGVYYDVMENINEHDYIENINQCDNTPICDTCNKFIENENILQDIKKYQVLMNKNPSNVLCNECIENI